MTDVPSFDREVRAGIARAIRERGSIPTIDDIASLLGRDRAAVDASFARLIDGHVFIPRRGSREIYAYDPFCVGPTDFRVRADGREWWGICGWDALGIAPALGTSGTLETDCADSCGERLVLEVPEQGAVRGAPEVVLHVGVPAREFWSDIYFT